MTIKKPLVTILIPNYKTLELTTLCLRLIRKFTDQNKIEVIVIDNDSRDASLDYLRRLAWIKLIERSAIPDEGSISAHSRALDRGLQEVRTPYVLSIHTDTLIRHPHWLEFLIGEIEKRPTIAGVGSWKLESKPLWKQALKSVERNAQRAFYHLTGQQNEMEGSGNNYYYLRSHCALYRMDLIHKLNLHFSDEDRVAGKAMHKRLIDAGYEMIFLPSGILGNYLDHINHATSILNPELSLRMRSVSKGMQRIQQTMSRMNDEGILFDKSLDA